MIEQWKDVVGYEGLYQVSNHGRVKTMARLHRENRPYMKKERLLNPPINSAGYPQVALYKDKKGVIHSVHKLVATAFLDRKAEHQVVNHIDGNKQNNHVDNLEWCTYGHNHSHAIRTGLIVMPTGERARGSKMSNEARHFMIELKSAGMSSKHIGWLFGVVEGTVNDIIIAVKARPHKYPVSELPLIPLPL